MYNEILTNKNNKFRLRKALFLLKPLFSQLKMWVDHSHHHQQQYEKV